MSPIRSERLVVRGKEVDVLHPKQLPRETTDTFNLSTLSFSVSSLSRVFADTLMFDLSLEQKSHPFCEFSHKHNLWESPEMVALVDLTVNSKACSNFARETTIPTRFERLVVRGKELTLYIPSSSLERELMRSTFSPLSFSVSSLLRLC